MSIRRATHSDAAAISGLLTQLGYPGTAAFLADRLAAMLQDPNEVILVWEEPPAATPTPTTGTPPAPPTTAPVLGFLALHFIPQIALAGDFARISYFSVDEAARSRGIGRLLEAEAARLARERGCHLLEVHCAAQRCRAHKFYARQGYIESPKYLIKKL